MIRGIKTFQKLNLIKAEFYKLFHNLSFWGITLFSLILSSLLLLDSKNQTADMLHASSYNTPLLYFLAIIFGALYVGDDLGERTLNCFVSSGHKRSLVLFAKTFAYQTACFIILVLPVVIHGLLGLFIQGSEAVINKYFPADCIVLFISIIAMCMLPLFCAFVFRELGTTLAVSIAMFFLMIFILNGDQAQLFWTILPMGQIRLIALKQFPISLLHMAVIDILWVLVLYTGAYFTFYRSDLK